MNEKEFKFINLANELYQNKWIHFTLSNPGWACKYREEEKIFAVVIRTLLCNDECSEQFFLDIGGFRGVKDHYTSKIELEQWLHEKISRYSLGKGKGSHRDNRHKSSTPRTISEYLELTKLHQREFLDNTSTFYDLMVQLRSVYYIGSLTAFDISKRLVEADLIDFSPQRFYLTGTGEVNGLKALYPKIKGYTHLEKMGSHLMQQILKMTKIPPKIAFFGIEDLLCIYQKDQRYKSFLACKISVEEYASYMLKKKSIRERSVC